MKTYIGDGVYVSFNDAGQLVLTAEDGIRAHDTIYLEPEVYVALTRYVDSLKTRAAWVSR